MEEDSINKTLKRYAELSENVMKNLGPMLKSMESAKIAQMQATTAILPYLNQLEEARKSIAKMQVDIALSPETKKAIDHIQKSIMPELLEATKNLKEYDDLRTKTDLKVEEIMKSLAKPNIRDLEKRIEEIERKLEEK